MTIFAPKFILVILVQYHVNEMTISIFLKIICLFCSVNNRMARYFVESKKVYSCRHVSCRGCVCTYFRIFTKAAVKNAFYFVL